MFVTKEKYCEETGLKETTLEGWIKRQLTRGVHFVVHGRTTLVDPEAIEQWLIDQQTPVIRDELTDNTARNAATTVNVGAGGAIKKLQLPERYRTKS